MHAFPAFWNHPMDFFSFYRVHIDALLIVCVEYIMPCVALNQATVVVAVALVLDQNTTTTSQEGKTTWLET
jgi:hypothetical protein